jgi:hypothetical protein
VAEGRYRIVALEWTQGREPQAVRLHLEPLAAANAAAFALLLPPTTVDDSRLGVGDVVQARHRVYGIEFARADTQQPFFLALDDAWQRGLRTTPVGG